MKSESVQISVSAGADKTLSGPKGSFRHIAFTLRVSEPVLKPERRPVTIALVIDRSGSMHGQKMEAAKAAATKVIRSLEGHDRFSVVCFDEEITTLVACTAAGPQEKEKALAQVAALQARGSTDLHTGWLTGCRNIAPEKLQEEWVSHCFLLTDGLANHGETDSETIASQAADVRLNTGIGTSTFGIGEDYDETLLAPMAVAGGGQFHHLRKAEEIEKTFTGELAELFASAVRSVRLEIETAPDTAIESISDYHMRKAPDGTSRFLDVGNLMAGEERHIVIRVALPALDKGEKRSLRCRLHWTAGEEQNITETGELHFEGATEEECAQASPDPEVLHWVGLHHGSRTKRLVMLLLSRGENQAARKLLQTALSHLEKHPAEDKEIRTVIQELKELLPLTEENAHIDRGIVKDVMYSAQLYSRGQRDFRGQGRE
jgi:Ca-activated chloride channel homolog